MESFFQPIKDAWVGLDPTTRVIIGVLGTCVLIVVAVYVIQLFRRMYSDDSTEMDGWKSIGEMHEDGTLREYEYQHLRKKMAEKLGKEPEELPESIGELDPPETK